MNKGAFAAFCAYFIWGVSIVFWKLLGNFPADILLCFRIFFSLVVILFFIRFESSSIKQIISKQNNVFIYLFSGLLLGTNWVTFVWGVNNNHVLDVSLGYFITPIVSILFGIIFLQEQASRLQKLSIVIIFLGVSYITFQVGKLPYVSLILAFSFGTYGLIKKRTTLAETTELGLETAFLIIPAIIYFSFKSGFAMINDIDFQQWILLVCSGLLTVIPLLLFAYGAKRIKLIYLGVLQFFAPSIQFSIGIFLYREALDFHRLIGFIFVWFAIAIYISEKIIKAKYNRLS